jgi:cytochrome d ubiquinol oxidase subunit II
MALQATWFIFITVLWSGFFVLEGFDFGVGMLVPFLGRDDLERRVLRATTGPFWDGNEVWLVTAGAATFAAFADWYATMFSAYYLPLFVVVLALILRAVGVEFRDKIADSRWRHVWDWITVGCCVLVPLLIGTAFGGLLNGLPIDQQMEFTGSFASLVQPYALFTGILFAALCLLQGLMFLRIKTTGDLATRASRTVRPVAWIVVAVLAVHIVWTRFAAGSGVIPNLGAWLALTFAVAAAWLAANPEHRGAAFGCSAATIAFTVISFFAELYPNLMVSTTSAAYDITTANSSGSYTLTLMTIVTVVMAPIVIIYTAWNYWVFRQRLTVDDVSPEPARDGS